MYSDSDSGEVENEEEGTDDLMTTSQLPETMKEAADTSTVGGVIDVNNDNMNEMNADQSSEKLDEAVHEQVSVDDAADAERNNIYDSYVDSGETTTLESNGEYSMDDDTKIDTVAAQQELRKVAPNNNEDPTKVSDESVDNTHVVLPTSEDNVQKEGTVQNDNDEMMEDISTDDGNIIGNSAEEVVEEQIIVLPTFNHKPKAKRS